ncbi:MAG TPA: hypothetical protein VG944_15590 [Fimbriimonas sp.]|nr:hypothetical protein [Fimbriimonas sp.]
MRFVWVLGCVGIVLGLAVLSLADGTRGAKASSNEAFPAKTLEETYVSGYVVKEAGNVANLRSRAGSEALSSGRRTKASSSSLNDLEAPFEIEPCSATSESSSVPSRHTTRVAAIHARLTQDAQDREEGSAPASIAALMMGGMSLLALLKKRRSA